MATGYHLRAKQKAGTDAPPLGKSSAPAYNEALAIFDIHDVLCLAAPAPEDQTLSLCFRVRLLVCGLLAVGTDVTSVPYR